MKVGSIFYRKVQAQPLSWFIATVCLLASFWLLVAPTLPVWTERHTPHTHRPPLSLSSGQTVNQSFTFEHPKLDRLLLWLDVAAAPLPATGDLEITVGSGTTTRIVQQRLEDVPTSGLIVVPLIPPLADNVGHVGSLKLTLREPNQKVAFKYQADPSKYPGGGLSKAGERVKGDLAFQLRYERPALGTYKNNALYALVIFVAGLWLAWQVRRRFPEVLAPSMAKRDVAIAIACGLVTIIFYGLYLWHPGFWVGPSDFSKDTIYVRAAAEAVKAGQWPVWSHLTCGGMALLGNPEGNTFSLATLFGLFWPPDRAFLANLIVEAGLAATGSYLLARSLKISTWGSLLAAVITIISPGFAYRIVEGFTPVGGAVAFTPWVWLGFVQALSAKTTTGHPWVILAGVSLGAILLRGEVHIITALILCLIVWTAFTTVRRRSWQPLLVLATIGCISFLLGSIKIVAYLEQPNLIGRGQILPYVAELSHDNFAEKFLLRVQDRTNKVEVLHGNYAEGFGAFGTYVGLLPLALAGLGFWQRRPYRWELLVTCVFVFVLSEGTVFELYLRHIPGLDALMRVPTRFLSIWLVLVGLLAGRGFDRLLRDPRPGLRYLPAGALGIILVIDLGLATHQVFTRNLEWDPNPLELAATAPTLMPHQNDSLHHNYHATKLNRAGFMLPLICGDQNNPPEFIRSLSQPIALADVPTTLTPNHVNIQDTQGQRAITIRERFVSSWETSTGDIIENDDGSILAVLPPQTTALTLTYKDPLIATQILLSLLGILLVISLASAVRSGIIKK